MKLYIKELRCQLKWLVWTGPQASPGEGATTGIVMKWFPKVSPWVQWGKALWHCFLLPLSALVQAPVKGERGQWEVRKLQEEDGYTGLVYLTSVVLTQYSPAELSRVEFQSTELKQPPNWNWELCPFCSQVAELGAQWNSEEPNLRVRRCWDCTALSGRYQLCELKWVPVESWMVSHWALASWFVKCGNSTYLARWCWGLNETVHGKHSAQ